jgi:hypothetical protein
MISGMWEIRERGEFHIYTQISTQVIYMESNAIHHEMDNIRQIVWDVLL